MYTKSTSSVSFPNILNNLHALIINHSSTLYLFHLKGQVHIGRAIPTFLPLANQAWLSLTGSASVCLPQESRMMIKIYSSDFLFWLPLFFNSNIVTTMDLGCPVNLLKISYDIPNTKFNYKTYPAVFVKMRELAKLDLHHLQKWKSNFTWK